MELPKRSSTDESNEAHPKPVRSHGGSSTTSPVWKYFKLNENNPIQATCLMCGTLMSRGGVSPSRCGTTNLRRHLSFAHGIVLPSKKKPQQTIPFVLQQAETTSKSLLTAKPKQKKPLVLPEPSSHEPLPYEICLRWKSYHLNMQSMFPSLLNNEHFVDVTLACEGRSIKCHRVILSACSSYFEDILCHTSCQHPIIIIKDLCFQELRTLVDFMYSGEVYVAQERLPMLLAAAEALQVKGLSGSSTSHDEETLPTPSINEPKCSNFSDINLSSKQKSSTVREKYQNLPGTSRSVSVTSSDNNRTNGIQNILSTAVKSRSSFSHYSHKQKLKSPMNQVKCKSGSQNDDKSNNFSSKIQRKKAQPEPQDIIITNDSICPAPICELSDHESVNTNGEGDDKTWNRDHEMEDMDETDDNSEADDNDGPSVRLLMVPEVVMDCSDDTES